MSIIFVLSIFFIAVTLVFVVIAVFLPEWIGITGKKAKRIIAEQQDTSKKDDEPPQGH